MGLWSNETADKHLHDAMDMRGRTGITLLGLPLQWPPLLTLAMYARLARAEERDLIARFPVRYADYAAHVPAFLPHIHWEDRAKGTRP